MASEEEAGPSVATIFVLFMINRFLQLFWLSLMVLAKNTCKGDNMQSVAEIWVFIVAVCNSNNKKLQYFTLNVDNHREKIYLAGRITGGSR
jgi:hypothetical protein